MRRAVFLDRDGIINKTILKEGKLFSPRTFEEFEILDGVRIALEEFKEAGFINVIVTNQPDIARGLMSQATLDRIHEFVKESLPIDDVFVCPHDDIDNCHCRKPKGGMFLDAANKWRIDLKSSFLVGDQWKDIAAGKEVGCTTILISYQYNKGVKPDFRADNITSAAKIILKNESRKY